MENQKEQTAVPTVNEQQNHKNDHPDTGRVVTITIDGVDKEIHRGRYTVVELKNLGGIPLAYDLEQVIDGKLVPLPDDGAVTIKGGEKFVGHPKDSGSSAK